MTSFLALDVFAHVISALSLISKLQLIIVLQRLPCHQRNERFDFYLYSSCAFSAICLFLSFGDIIAPKLLDCTSFTTVLIFVLFQKLSDAALIVYGTSLYPGYNSFLIRTSAMLSATFCAIVEVVLVYHSTSKLDQCHGSLISSMEGTITVLALQSSVTLAIALIIATGCFRRAEGDPKGRALTRRSCVLSILSVGALGKLSTVILSVVSNELNVVLHTYNNIAIVYCTEGFLISIVALITCPTSRSAFTCVLPKKSKKSRVSTVPKQQLYCSFALRKVRHHHDASISQKTHVMQSEDHDVSVAAPSCKGRQLSLTPTVSGHSVTTENHSELRID